MSESTKTSQGHGESETAGDLKSTVSQVTAEATPTIAAFKDQASHAAQDAKSTVTALADEARQRLSEIVDQQKSAGADQVAGVARAARAASGDLEGTSPQLARLINTAADSVEHVAENIRGQDLGDVITSITDFGRRQPVALFGGAIVVGFLLARFLKSDGPASASSSSFARRSA